MNIYTIKILSSQVVPEYYSTIDDSFTFDEFLDWFEHMKSCFDYSEDYFHFIPVDGGTEMYRKGNDLTEVTKQEFNSALLTITMFQGD